MSVRDYYFVSGKNFDKLIENNCSNYINVINCTIEPYHVEGKQEIIENNILYYRKVKDDFSITFYDLLYPKLDLDKLFSQTEADTDTIEKLKEQIADLENQLAQANAALADKPADDYQQLSERTEKSYQTTIGLLLELMVTPKGIDHKQPFPSQAVIINEIIDKGIYGQGKSTLETRFSDANSILNDAKKK